MELPPNITCYSTGLFLKKSKTLILGDLHIGAEEELLQKGYHFPKTQQKHLQHTITELIKEYAPKTILFNGDIKHSFGTINPDEWKDVLQVLDTCMIHATVLVNKGNHDASIKPILQKRKIPQQEFALIDGCYITHGDKNPKTNEEKKALEQAHTIIIGHEHPSYNVDDGIRKENYKCFLLGTYEDKKIIVMPSTYPLVEGTDITGKNALGPYMKKIRNKQVYVATENKPLYFGRMQV